MTALPTACLPIAWQAPSDTRFEIQNPELPLLDELFTSQSLVGRSGTSIPLDVYIPRLQGQLLYSLVQHLAPSVTLEVGLANGISALYIAAALRNNGAGRHIAIDPFQSSDWQQAGLVSLERAGLDCLVSLDERPSHWALPDLERQGVRVQFAFIDGSHQFDYVMTDFMCVDRVLDVGGMIAFDDSDWPAIRSVIRYAISNRAYEVFDPGVVVEPSPIHPRLPSRLLRKAARWLPPLQRILCADFVVPDHEQKILGRCVVLRKTDHDKRDSQSRFLVPF